jgi:O-6-methylguanine DNA methyltransferase
MRKTEMEGTGTLELARQLRELAQEKAPPTLLPAVLARVGLAADSYWTIPSPVGPVYVARSFRGITRVSRAASAASFERQYRERFGRPVHPDSSRPPAAVRTRIEDRGNPAQEDIEFDLAGLTEFEQAVLKKALEIPRGQVRPYGWIAREIGHPEAVRATGSALAKNPVPLLIPCHRVVRSDGTIGNYSMGGTRAKKRILAAEGAQPETIEQLAAAGVRYLGNERKHYFCYPTCGGIGSLIKENTVPFHSAQEALAAGFRPCGDCRPAVAAA